MKSEGSGPKRERFFNQGESSDSSGGQADTAGAAGAPGIFETSARNCAAGLEVAATVDETVG